MIYLLDTSKTDATNKLLTISRFLKLARFPVFTIRYYMKEGKLKTMSFSQPGYAKFSEKQVKDVQKILSKRYKK